MEEEYVVIRDSGDLVYLYMISGELEFTGLAVFPIREKYLAYLIQNTNREMVYKIENLDREVIYEEVIPYDDSSIDSNFLIFEAMTTYENSEILLGTNIQFDEEGYIDETYSVYALRDYKIISGDKQTYEDKDLVFKFNGEYELFNKILVDDEVLKEDEYTASKGSTIIILKSDYLKTLSNGEHILRVEYSDGGYVGGSFETYNITSKTYKINFDTNGGAFKDKKTLMTIEKWDFSVLNTQEKPLREGY